MVCVFARKTSEPLASLVKQIDSKIGENGELKSFVVIVPKRGENPAEDSEEAGRESRHQARPAHHWREPRRAPRLRNRQEC